MLVFLFSNKPTKQIKKPQIGMFIPYKTNQKKNFTQLSAYSLF